MTTMVYLEKRISRLEKLVLDTLTMVHITPEMIKSAKPSMTDVEIERLRAKLRDNAAAVISQMDKEGI